MGKRRPDFNQGDVCRAIAGARKAGIEVAQVEIKKDGTITIRSTTEDQAPPDSLDRELAEFSERHGRD